MSELMLSCRAPLLDLRGIQCLAQQGIRVKHIPPTKGWFHCYPILLLYQKKTKNKSSSNGRSLFNTLMLKLLLLLQAGVSFLTCPGGKTGSRHFRLSGALMDTRAELTIHVSDHLAQTLDLTWPHLTWCAPGVRLMPGRAVHCTLKTKKKTKKQLNNLYFVIYIEKTQTIL